MGASEDDLTSVATQSEQVRAILAYGWNRDDDGPRSHVALWIGPRGLTTRRGHEPGPPSIEQRFPEVVDGTLDRRLLHLAYGVRLARDWRVGAPHWSSGWRARLESERFDVTNGLLALGMEGGRGAQFTRTTIELESGFSFFMDDPRTLRIRGRIIDTGVSGGREHMTVLDLASLGGDAGLAGYRPGRFHDLDLIAARATYVFPLLHKLEFDLHAESGAVASDLWRTTRFDRLEQSFGFALRVRSKWQPVGAIGLDFSREMTRVHLTLGDPDS
jgi:hypothetical protein